MRRERRSPWKKAPLTGAALLAGTGVGLWRSVDEAVEAVVRRASVTEPNADAVGVMNEQYERYRRLYPWLRDIEAKGGS